MIERDAAEDLFHLVITGADFGAGWGGLLYYSYVEIHT